jgi:hypothetical protein
MFEHADRDPGYGAYRLEGMEAGRRRSIYDSRTDASPSDATAPVDPDTKEVGTDSLQELVRSTPESETGDMSQSSSSEEGTTA